MSLFAFFFSCGHGACIGVAQSRDHHTSENDGSEFHEGCPFQFVSSSKKYCSIKLAQVKQIKTPVVPSRGPKKKKKKGSKTINLHNFH